uniref:Uncharacterized protein n=1 Tax=Arundo donax TaxID=35708 RepID=A0A0A8YL50_ARUDO
MIFFKKKTNSGSCYLTTKFVL